MAPIQSKGAHACRAVSTIAVAEVAGAKIEAAEKLIVLTESSKFNRSALFTVPALGGSDAEGACR